MEEVENLFYLITRTTTGKIEVMIAHEPDGKALDSYLPQVIFHSPTGFEIGYGGSGPADLALSILTNYFAIDPVSISKALRLHDRPLTEKMEKVWFLHHDFKWSFLANVHIEPGEIYAISKRMVRDWVNSR